MFTGSKGPVQTSSTTKSNIVLDISEKHLRLPVVRVYLLSSSMEQDGYRPLRRINEPIRDQYRLKCEQKAPVLIPDSSPAKVTASANSKSSSLISQTFCLCCTSLLQMLDNIIWRNIAGTLCNAAALLKH